MPFASEAAYRQPARQWLSRSLVAIGIACLLVYSFFVIRTSLYQREAKAQLERAIAAPESPTMTRTPMSPVNPGRLARGSVIGRVDVPRLHLSAAIAEGDDDATLDNAVGHLPDTPLPWQLAGNAAFAAHRDGLFRPLRDIRVNDEIRMVTARGEFLYRVKRTQVVNPEDVWVLAPTKAATITLITCYPFTFVGHAPQRFIVQAERLVPELSGTPLKGKV